MISWEFLISQFLCLTAVAAFMIANATLGFFGTVAGEYRIRKAQGRNVPLSAIWKEKEKEFWCEHSRGDIAPTVALIIFAHIGFVFLLLVWFGPVGQDKSTESRIKLK